MAGAIEWRGQDRFFARLEKLARSYPGATDQCAGGIGLDVIKHAITLPPRVPKKTGTLRASGTFLVSGGAHWRQCKLVVGFNTSYAARVHQIPMRFNQQAVPGAGNYFLSWKLRQFHRVYIQRWVNCVSRKVGTA